MIVLVLLLLVLAGLPRSPARAADDGPRLALYPGFGGAGRSAVWVPVVVEVANAGPEWSGRVEVSIDDSGAFGPLSRPPVVFTRSLLLPTRSNKRVEIDVFLPNPTRGFTARLVNDAGVAAETSAEFHTVSTSELLCGVAARNPAALGLLETVELEGLQRHVQTVPIDLRELPTRPQLLESLDCLVLSGGPGTVTPEQQSALQSWVANGGVVIITGGAGWQRSLAPLPEALLPVTVRGLRPVPSLDALIQFARNTPFSGAGPWLVSDGTPVADAHVLVEQDGVPLLAVVRRGQGSVFYLALDPAGEPLRAWDGSTYLWTYLLSQPVTSVIPAPPYARSYVGWGRVPRSALSELAPVTPPPLAGLGLVAGAYLLALGPANFLLLRRLRRLELSWISLPLLMAMAGTLALLAATGNRAEDLHINKVTLVRLNAHSDLAYTRSYLGLFSPRKGSYTLRTDESSLPFSLFYPFPRTPWAQRTTWRLQIDESAAATVGGYELESGTIGSLLIDSQWRVPGRVHSSLVLGEGALHGQVTNALELPIDDAALVVGYDVYPLGRLEPGETREVDFPFTASPAQAARSPGAFPLAIYPALEPGQAPASAPKRSILDAVFGQSYYFPRLQLSGVTLVGWLPRSPQVFEAVDVRAAEGEATLLMASLPITLPRGREIAIPASLMDVHRLGQADATRLTTGYELAYGGTIALQFNSPLSAEAIQARELILNVDGTLGSSNTRGLEGSPLGQVMLFDWRLLDWVARPLAFGENRVTDAARFVSPTGSVRLRYQFNPPVDSGQTRVTFERFELTMRGWVE